MYISTGRIVRRYKIKNLRLVSRTGESVPNVFENLGSSVLSKLSHRRCHMEDRESLSTEGYKFYVTVGAFQGFSE